LNSVKEENTIYM